MSNPITAAIIDSMTAPAPAHTVTVTWANGSRATYSAAMLDILKTDPAALDIQDDTTGELVYIRPAAEEQTRRAMYQAITAAGVTLHPCNTADTAPADDTAIYYLTTEELTDIYADITAEA